MDEQEWLAQQFEESRGHLKAVAYRMLGSVNEADDAVQEGWLRLNRSRASGVANLSGWLTTVVARVCLDMLRSRKARREEPLESHVPDPIVSRDSASDPERETLLADSVGLALLVVLETLEPAECLAFVLHDMFSVPFDDLAGILDRSPAAARQLASRARRQVQGMAPAPDADMSRQREVVNAFLAASRNGDFDALLAVLDPDVVLRADAGSLHPGVSKVVRGARKSGGPSIALLGVGAALPAGAGEWNSGTGDSAGRSAVCGYGFRDPAWKDCRDRHTCRHRKTAAAGPLVSYRMSGRLSKAQ